MFELLSLARLRRHVRVYSSAVNTKLLTVHKSILLSDFGALSLLAAASNKKVFDYSDLVYIRKDLVDRPRLLFLSKLNFIRENYKS